MAELTVYIPDEFLDRARAPDPGASTSQLVQRGLERLSPAEDAAYARRPDDAAELLAAASGKIRDGAAREYEKGYRAALVMVSKAGDVVWPGLDDLARTGFVRPRWAEAWRRGLSPEEGFKPPDWYLPLPNDPGSLLDPVGFDQWSFTPSGPFIRGYQSALRDAWQTAERPHPAMLR